MCEGDYCKLQTMKEAKERGIVGYIRDAVKLMQLQDYILGNDLGLKIKLNGANDIAVATKAPV